MDSSTHLSPLPSPRSRLAALSLSSLLAGAISLYVLFDGGNRSAAATAIPARRLDERGQQLRAAIEEKVKRADTAKVTISDVVVHYIPVGTSFIHAEVILHNAGFDCRLVRTGTTSPHLIASGELFTSEPFNTSQTEAVIEMFPESGGDFNGEIGKVEAAAFSKETAQRHHD